MKSHSPILDLLPRIENGDLILTSVQCPILLKRHAPRRLLASVESIVERTRQHSKVARVFPELMILFFYYFSVIPFTIIPFTLRSKEVHELVLFLYSVHFACSKYVHEFVFFFFHFTFQIRSWTCLISLFLSLYV